MEYTLDENLAQRIFMAAVAEDRAAELMDALWEGAAPTVDMITGKLIIASKTQLDRMFGIE